MDDSLQKTIDSLRLSLNGDLPGVDAQVRMAPDISGIDRFDLENQKDAREGGVLIALYPMDGQVFMPLMKRADYAGVHSGQISLPGGKREESDPDLEWTALREAHEEMGIQPHEVEVVGQLTELFIIASNYRVLPVVGILRKAPALKPDPREVIEIIQTPVEHLLDRSNVKQASIEISRGTIKAPYFDVQGHMVWGATAMILSEFLTLYKDL